MNKFSGKTALITGGAEGIGLAVAKSLGAEQMNIVLADIDEAKHALASAELEQLGIPFLTLSLGVSEEFQWLAVAEKA